MSPSLTEAMRLERLSWPESKVRVVIDTDPGNEIDDQFAITYALLCPDKLAIEAIYAAPFATDRFPDPRDGVTRSYTEISAILKILNMQSYYPVKHGSPSYLADPTTPVESEAAADLVQRGMSSDQPLYVIAIAALTNIASALLIEPRLKERIIVVWLGGHGCAWPDTDEYNLRQDVSASRIILDCEVPLIRIPCIGVASHMRTTIPEAETYLNHGGAISAHLLKTFKNYHDDHFAWSRPIWDLAAVGYLVDRNVVPTALTPSPILTDQLTWRFDHRRHLIRTAYHVHRDMIFRDFFRRIAGR